MNKTVVFNVNITFFNSPCNGQEGVFNELSVAAIRSCSLMSLTTHNFSVLWGPLGLNNSADNLVSALKLRNYVLLVRRQQHTISQF